MAETGLTERTLAALAPTAKAPPEFSAPLSTRQRDQAARWVLRAADAVAVMLSVIAVSMLTGAEVTVWSLGLLPLFVLLAKMAGLYDRDQFVLRKTTLDEAPALVAVAAIFALVIEGVQGLEFTGRSHPVLLWGLLCVALMVTRTAARFVSTRTSYPERILIIGDAAAVVLVKRKLAEDPSLNGMVIGRVSAEGTPQKTFDRVLGTIDELPDLIHKHRVERVIVAPSREGGDDVVEVVRFATASGVRVTVLPRLLEVIGTSVEFDDLGGQVLLGVRAFGLSPWSRFIKRVFDLLVTAVVLVILTPLLLAIAAAIKLTSRGPVLFQQTRVGRDGKEFQVLKFRTMCHDAEARKEELAERNEAAPLFKIADDPRTTRVGRFLRRNSLDELPQLFNVLRGDMSLVGPRPFIVEEDRLFSGWQRQRYHVSPGITGPWQILGSSRVPVSDMVSIDYLYCANWSLWLDAKILARTIPYVLSGRSPEHTPRPSNDRPRVRSRS
jgi:exopolysaccharide biosynthesis polyprenyl glycosylphosphotransferase